MNERNPHNIWNTFYQKDGSKNVSHLLAKIDPNTSAGDEQLLAQKATEALQNSNVTEKELFNLQEIQKEIESFQTDIEEIEHLILTTEEYLGSVTETEPTKIIRETLNSLKRILEIFKQDKEKITNNLREQIIQAEKLNTLSNQKMTTIGEHLKEIEKRINPNFELEYTQLKQLVHKKEAIEKKLKEKKKEAEMPTESDEHDNIQNIKLLETKLANLVNQISTQQQELSEKYRAYLSDKFQDSQSLNN